MCTLSHLFFPAEPDNNRPLLMHLAGLQALSPEGLNGRPPLFQVIPAGIGFFHIKEISTGRVRGFREDHNQACALARSFESQIELLTGDRLR